MVNREENILRDYIADNLSIIESDLKLIKKEFYLKSRISSKGYIDILAKDKLSNFVVIEIKRSESAARQTINELLKYQGLIKQEFNAQESEIRLIVISSKWNELIIPYSEIFNSVCIVGYMAKLDTNSIPISFERVQPIDLNAFSRKLSPSHSLDLFYNEVNRENFIKELITKLTNIEILDFVIVTLKSNGKNKRIIYPFISYLAFQRQPKYRYFEIVENLQNELDDIDFDSESHELKYIEECLIASLELPFINDSTESGNPKKFMGILNCGEWEVEGIKKYGTFETDPRLSDEIILNEIKGYDGENECRYLDFADSKQTKKLEKVQNNLRNSLKDNEIWLNHIENCFEYVKSLNQSFRVVVEIFYPDSIFDSVWRTLVFNNINYLPAYNLFFSFVETNEILAFTGAIEWNGNRINRNRLLNKLKEDDFTTFTFSLLGSFDEELIPLMNLEFCNKQLTLSNGAIINIMNIEFLNNKISLNDKKHYSILVFYEENMDVMIELSKLYQTYTNIL